VKASVRRGGDAAHRALVEVAELLSARSRGATDSGDLDVGADSDIGVNRHSGPLDNFLIVAG